MYEGYKPTVYDWIEDFSHENGNYNNQCSFCPNDFIGHKRRFICHLCYEKKVIEKQEKEKTIVVKTARIDEIISDVKREFYYINDEGEENEAALSIIQKLEEIKKKG